MQPSHSLLILAAALHALLVWAAFPPVNLWPLIVLAPAPLAWMAVRAPSTRFAVLTAIGAHIVLWTVISRWMIQVTELGFPFYVLAMAAWNGGMFAWVFRRIHQTRLPMTLTLPIIWVALEALRGEFIFDGYPWYFLAHPLVEAPILAQSADLFGTYFVSFLTAMVSGAALDVMRARRGEVRWREAASGIAAVVVIHAANIAYGAWRLNQTAPLSDGPAILLIQTNLPQDNKMGWTPEEKVRDFHAFLELTGAAYRTVAAEGGPVDLIVWPETMLPGFGLEREMLEYLFEHDYDLELHFAEQITAEVAHSGVPMLVGSPAVLGLGTREVLVNGEEMLAWTWDAQYNSAYLIQGELPFQRYDKVFLTPFGETMPYISRWPALEERLLAIGARGMRFDLDAGDELRTLDLEWRGGVARLATPICFEVTVGWLNRRFVYGPGGEKRTDVLVNVTNDGWFGFHGAGRVQHAQISRFRAIENRVPMVRAANTGVSVSIDSAGRLDGAIGKGSYGEPKRDGFLYTTVAIDARRTLYGRIGDLWAWMCVMLAVLLTAATWIGRRHRMKGARE